MKSAELSKKGIKDRSEEAKNYDFTAINIIQNKKLAALDAATSYLPDYLAAQALAAQAKRGKKEE